MEKIDIHSHTSPRKIEGILPKDATLDTLSEEMKKYKVKKTLVLASYFPHKHSGITNYRLLHWIQDRPEFEMIGSLDFEHYFIRDLMSLKNSQKTIY